MLVRLVQQAALDQPARAAAPGRIGARAQVGLFDVDERPGFDVADLVGHRVIRAADAGDDSDHRLVRVKPGRDPGIAPLALVQFACLGRFIVDRPDVDQLVASRCRDQPARLLGRQPQLLAVDVVGRRVRRCGAEILQFKWKHREFDRLRCNGLGRHGEETPGKLLLFVVLQDAFVFDDLLANRIRERIKTDLSPRYLPDALFCVSEIPQTLNGKKLEIPVKRLFQGFELSKSVSLEAMKNPDSLKPFLDLAERFLRG